MDSKRHSLSLTYHKGYLYAIGGSDGFQKYKFSKYRAITTVERFDLKKGQWERYGHLCEARVGHRSISLDSGLYVVGGWNGKHYVRAVERFDEAKGKFKVVMELKEGRAGFSICPENQNLNFMMMGGFNKRGSLQSCEKVDPISTKISKLKNLKECRSDGGCFLLF